MIGEVNHMAPSVSLDVSDEWAIVSYLCSSPVSHPYDARLEADDHVVLDSQAEAKATICIMPLLGDLENM